MTMVQKKCSKCNAENPIGVRKCRGCGEAFPFKARRKAAKIKAAPPHDDFKDEAEFVAGINSNSGLSLFWPRTSQYIELTKEQTEIVRYAVVHTVPVQLTSIASDLTQPAIAIEFSK